MNEIQRPLSDPKLPKPCRQCQHAHTKENAVDLTEENLKCYFDWLSLQSHLTIEQRVSKHLVFDSCDQASLSEARYPLLMQERGGRQTLEATDNRVGFVNGNSAEGL